MKTLKKSIALILAAIMLVICGCTPAEQGYTSDPTESVAQGTVSTEASDATEETTDGTESTEGTEATGGTEGTDATEGTEATTPVESEPATEATEPVTEPAETEPAETQPQETEPKETEPEVTYKEVNETVYVTSSTVNVRSGPGTGYSKLGSLSKGDSLKRIGIGSNGWSKVEYNGKTAYVFSDYVSTKKPTDNSSVSYDGLELAKLAVEYLGLEYVSGGNSLTKGTDCSGFTKLIFAEFGITLPRTAAEQAKLGKEVSQSEAKVGDLYAVAYDGSGRYTGHAGIYLGGGYIISAMPGQGVTIDFLWGDETLIQIGKNTAEEEYLEARDEMFQHYIDCGLPYEFRWDSEIVYYPETNSCTFYVQAEGQDFFGAKIDAIHDTDKYGELIKEWKKQYTTNEDACFRIEGEHSYGFLNKKWYTAGELYDMWDAGEITDEEYSLYFYGKPWDVDSGITTELGEEVDFSTFPG